MEQKEFLEDYIKWKNLNSEHFSFQDYIYHIMDIDNVKTDLCFAFLELFWPQFILYKNQIFLKDTFSEKRYQEIQNTPHSGEKNVEYWMNITLVQSFFNHEQNEEKRCQIARSLAHSLADMWNTKLQRDFPLLKFKVDVIEDEDGDDYGLTFYQK